MSATQVAPKTAATAAEPDAPASGKPRSRPGLVLLGAVIAILFVLPLWWTVASALRPQRETFATISPVSLWTLVPRDFTLANFGRLFGTGFGRAMLNSGVVTLATLIG